MNYLNPFAEKFLLFIHVSVTIASFSVYIPGLSLAGGVRQK
jgi:hypothetical protein